MAVWKNVEVRCYMYLINTPILSLEKCTEENKKLEDTEVQ